MRNEIQALGGRKKAESRSGTSGRLSRPNDGACETSGVTSDGVKANAWACAQGHLQGPLLQPEASSWDVLPESLASSWQGGEGEASTGAGVVVA